MDTMKTWTQTAEGQCKKEVPDCIAEVIHQNIPT